MGFFFLCCVSAFPFLTSRRKKTRYELTHKRMLRILMKHLAVIKPRNHNSIALYIFRPKNFAILKYLAKKSELKGTKNVSRTHRTHQ